MSKRRKLLILAIIVLLAAGAIFAARDWFYRQYFRPTGSDISSGVTSSQDGQAVEVVSRNLTVPWGLGFLPNGNILLAERSGTLKRVKDGHTYQIAGVRHAGEGGLLGLAIHPDFDQNNWIYVYLTTENGQGLINRVERYDYTSGQLQNKITILDNIPGAAYHDGGRIAFGPDDYLYITTGDSGQENLAQDIGSLAGKILRLTDEGRVPSDNPFNSPVYSYGHRNPQGLAWDDQDRLWSSEHGRSGVRSGYDEINLIKPGANYGWPLVEGNETREGMVSPVAHSGADETWAPASLSFLDGSLFFGGLRGESLFEAKIINRSQLEITAHFRGEFGRIRTIEFNNNDGQLYMTTSNTDGRGAENPGDDKLIRLQPQIFD